MLGTGLVDAGGGFAVQVVAADTAIPIAPRVVLADADLGSGNVYRAWGIVPPGSELGDAGQSEVPFGTVDPNSEASVRLSASGLPNLGVTLEGFAQNIGDLNTAVQAANAALNFAELNPSQAADLAINNATGNGEVQAILSRATLTSGRGGGGGCQVGDQPEPCVASVSVTLSLGLLWMVQRANRAQRRVARTNPSPSPRGRGERWRCLTRITDA